jgi:uncharacterized glyoxalase superfamily protein PhnB
VEHPTVFPTLTYDDADAALEFLTKAFGAQEHAVYRDEAGTIQHAEVRLGNGMVMFGAARGEVTATHGAGGGIYVVVTDPDGQCAQARSADAEIVRDLHDEPYGSREFSARDREGNTWHFGTYQPFAHDAAATAQAEATASP